MMSVNSKQNINIKYMYINVLNIAHAFRSKIEKILKSRKGRRRKKDFRIAKRSKALLSRKQTNTHFYDRKKESRFKKQGKVLISAHYETKSIYL